MQEAWKKMGGLHADTWSAEGTSRLWALEAEPVGHSQQEGGDWSPSMDCPLEDSREAASRSARFRGGQADCLR
jgi:hypothetical protein